MIPSFARAAARLAAATPLFAFALAGSAMAQDPEDPFLWLEEIESPRALEWVEQQNRATLAELSAHPSFEPIFERTVEVLDSDERIAYPNIMGDRLYNFWQDDDHPRGIWRRTTWESYLSGEPEWETVLDIDALAAAEGVNWSYGGTSCLAPEFRLCLVRLSRGGADAVQIREFDAATKAFVDGGFFLPEAKQSVTWVDRNTLLVSTDFGEGSMTTSGYPRIAKRWQRGTPLAAAETLFEAPQTDMGVWVGSIRTADRTYHYVSHRPRFFEGTLYMVGEQGLTKLDVPMDADPDVVRDQLVVYLRSPWETGGRTYEPGTLVAMPIDAFLAGQRDFQVVAQPGERGTISSVSNTRDYLLVSMLENVRSKLLRFRMEGGRWVADTIPTPEFGSVRVAATSPTTNRYFLTSEGFTQPTTLYLAEPDGTSREVASLPPMFDAEGLVVEQHAATSKDGTRIPYFVVRPANMQFDGTNPTLLYGYGGFEVSRTPGYSSTVGVGWLERGGVYVVANIRGGGEFGPRWHRAALKENRQRAYDDFIAVAEDLIARRITSPEHLGTQGGSNGGLLMGVMLTQRPELFDAIVIQVPLFDMLRYHKLLAGASWMAEYGNPDIPEERAYISRYSPYQNLRAGQPYPRVLITTTTRDDRVHPGHARKAGAKLESLGYPIYYFENTEGGHGAGVTSEQRARMYALVYAYLWQRLGEGEAERADR